MTYIIIIFSPLAQNCRHNNTKVREMCNGCNGVSLGNQAVPEGDYIPSLRSYRKALEQKSGFPGVFCDCGEASANLLCQLYRHLMPYTGYYHYHYFFKFNNLIISAYYYYYYLFLHYYYYYYYYYYY